MARLIDADALKEILRYKLIEFVKHPTFIRSEMEEGIDRGISCALLAINDAPTIQPDEPSAYLLTLNETLGGDECWIEGRSRACGYGDALLTDDAERVEFFRPHTINTLDFYAYGKEWRCWSHKPTDEQRKAAKWDDA